MRFLKDRWLYTPYFESFSPRLREGASFLDVGCGLGQEIRFLIADHGINPSHLYGFDLEPSFIDLGFELFRDRDRLSENFFATDVLNPERNARLSELKGNIDLIQVSQVLHVFDWDDMIKAVTNLVALLKPKPGCMIAGNQLGSDNPGSYEISKDCVPFGRSYRHNEASMKRFWQRVGELTNTEWDFACKEIYSEAVHKSRQAWWAKNDPGMNMIWFCATLLNP